ncbi:MAG: hypothetical protein K2X45_16090 [Phreatobacter sp.]|nr:hypothetical protein [Phreatobacter sp.]
MDDFEEIEIQGMVPAMSGTSVRMIEWVNFQNRAWLAPLWLPSRDGKWMRPVRLIAPKFAHGHSPSPSADVLNIFQHLPIPEVLLDSLAPQAVGTPLLEILENPQAISKNPAAGH